MRQAGNYKGFTIVELLIVVVVIAILATITIIAFNGIQERARVSAVATELKQVSTSISLWKPLNQDALPASLDDLNNDSIDTGSVEYWTFSNNSQYCLSTTENNKTYYTRSDTGTTILEGACSEIDWVAGEPLAYSDTPGQTVTFSSPLTGTPDITLYTLFSIVDANFTWNSFAGLSPSSDTNRFYFQGSSLGSTTAGYRIDTPAAFNSTGAQGGVRVAGYHIGWMQASSNATVRNFAYDQTNSHSTTSLNPGAGWNFTSMFLSANSSSSYVPIAAVTYNNAHDQTTRTNVMNWLAKKYNTGLSF